MIIERNDATTVGWTGSWTAIGLIAATANITLPGGAPSKVNITTHDDIVATGGYVQNGAGLIDVTDLTFEILLDPDDTQLQGMQTDMSNRVTREYRIRFPGVTRKWGIRGQISIASNADGTNYLRAQCTVLANAINFNVA
jgi:hypothetical protein